MNYCFQTTKEIVTTEYDAELDCEFQNYEPNFPKDVSWLLLFDNEQATWGLYEYSFDGDYNINWQPSHSVTSEMAQLIELAKQFPPALALTKGYIDKKLDFTENNALEFLQKNIQERLIKYLKLKDNHNFIRACSAVDEIGYLEQGEEYWILGLSKHNHNNVLWVSDDYYIYTNQITDFKLTNEQKYLLKVFLLDEFEYL